MKNLDGLILQSALKGISPNTAYGRIDEETGTYILEELAHLNNRRMKVIVLIPFFLSVITLLLALFDLRRPGHSFADQQEIIFLLRAASFLLIFLMLFAVQHHTRVLTLASIIAWIVLIAALTYSTNNLSTMIQLTLDVYLLNLFIFLPPFFSLGANTAIFAFFIIFHLPASPLKGLSPADGRIFELIPIFITFFFLIAVAAFLSIYEYKDMIRQIYLRKLNADQVETIRKQKERLEEMNRMRDHVDRIVRHDLKSPLNGIIGASRLLIEEVRTELASMVRMKNLDFTCDIIDKNEKTDSFEIEAERIKIASMLANLLKNAVEASPENETITVRVEKPDDKHISILIHNAGVIPQEIRAAFFERYTTSGKKHGTGLGTYSAKLVAEAHGGEISFTSSEDDGTSLLVRLPRKQGVELSFQQS